MASTRKAALDPVTQYATDVVRGRVVAGRLVRLACARHLADLEHQAAKGLVWKPESAQEVIDFFAEVLVLPENTDADDDDSEDEEENERDTVGDDSRPFVLSPFQAFIAGSLFGWHRVKGARTRRRFRVAYIETGKGSGKTPFGAGLLLYMLVADGERGAQVYCAAVTKDQAKLAFTDAERMVKASPALRELIDQKVNNLAVLSEGSFLRPISSEKKGLDGKRVHGVLIDEEHEHPSALVYLKMRAGTKGRRNALVLILTNSGFDLESVCWKHHDYSRQILEGLVDNEAWFAYVCHLDACAACQAAGKLQPSDECEDCDDWQTEGPHWLKANPNLGVSLPWEYLREQVREAIAIPSQRGMVRRLNFCQWTAQATVWIAPEKWAACASGVSREVMAAGLRGRDCVIGVDLSDKIDLSAVSVIFARPIEALDVDRPEDPDETDDEETAPAPRVVTIDFTADLLTYFWMPKNTLQRRATEDGIPYPEWEKSGDVKATAGSTIDHDAIVDFIINVLAKRFRVRGIGFDQAGATASVTRLQRHFGEERVIEVAQSFKALSEPSKVFEALIISRRVHHDGNKAMNWCMGNLAIEENDWREIRPIKIQQRKRIDGGVAAIVGLKVLGLLPPARQRTRGPRVWTPGVGFQAIGEPDQPDAR